MKRNEAQRVKFMGYLNNPPPPLDDLRRDDQFRAASWVHKKIQKRIRNLEEGAEENAQKKPCIDETINNNNIYE